MAKIIKSQELNSQVLEVNSSNQLDVKLANTGNVVFTKTSGGIQGDVTIPAAPEVPAALADVSIDNSTHTLTFTKTEGQPTIIPLPAAPVDVKLAGLRFEGGKLKATLSNNDEVEVDLTADVVVDALMNVQEPKKAQLKTFLKDLMKGEELQGLDGQTIGYVIAP